MSPGEAAPVVVGLVGPGLSLVLWLAKDWPRWEPLARALRQRERLQEQARELEAIGEYEWARRRHHAGEMVVARRLSRFEEYREHTVWSLVTMMAPVLWGAGFVAACLGALMGLSGPWGWVYGVGAVASVLFGLSLLVIVLVHTLWFDRKVQHRALRRVLRTGRALRARRPADSLASPSFTTAEWATSGPVRTLRA